MRLYDTVGVYRSKDALFMLRALCRLCRQRETPVYDQAQHLLHTENNGINDYAVGQCHYHYYRAVHYQRIICGEHDSAMLVRLRDRRITANKET